MLGDPVPGVAQSLRVARQIYGISEGVGARRTVRDRRLVEDTQTHGRLSIAHLKTRESNRDTAFFDIGVSLTFLAGTAFASTTVL
jgi:hypothetical protein